MIVTRVLIAIDGSDLALRAAQQGAALARALKAQVGLVCVVDPATLPVNDIGIPLDRTVADARLEADSFIAQARGPLGLAGDAPALIRVGSPGPQIVKAAREWKADLLVVGTHGRTGLTHLLLGSVAEYVVRRSECPVLVLPAEKRAG
jgi:nucleotide-binding universal stress UspA family protein